MLADIWPTYKIRINTPRLMLKLPSEAELAELAGVAATGVHAENERPFLVPWAERSAKDRARHILREHWSQLSSWRPASWQLGLGLFLHTGQPVGQATLRAKDFAVTREVATESWLGLSFHRQGYGTEARIALLSLAFDHLGATDATTEVFRDNDASQGVSRKLGYEHDGISRDARDDAVVISDRFRLTTKRWTSSARPQVTVTGLDEARPMFLSRLS